MAWDLIRPILTENGGWALFNYTPRGRNHGLALFQMAQNNPDWFCELLTVDDTDVVTPAMVQAERESGMSESKIKQEFYCSFEASLDACFFTGVLENHNYVQTGTIGSVLIDKKTKDIDFIENPQGIIELWRFPYFLTDNWDQFHWKYRYCIGSDIGEGLQQDYLWLMFMIALKKSLSPACGAMRLIRTSGETGFLIYPGIMKTR